MLSAESVKHYDSPSKYSRSQMLGNTNCAMAKLTLNSTVVHNRAGWHSAKQIHPDTSLTADLIQLLQTKTFQFQKQDTFNTAMWYLL